MVYSLTGDLYGWQNTGLSVPVGHILRVRASGYITTNTVDGGSRPTGWTCFTEGTYRNSATTHAVRLQDRVTWNFGFIQNEGVFPVLNGVVPMAVYLGIKGVGSTTPTFHWTRALETWDAVSGRDKTYTRQELWDAAGGKPGPYQVYAAFNDIQANSALDSIALNLTAELDGLSGTYNDAPWIFKYEQSESEPDRMNGGFCEETGFWAPQHSLVTVNGRRVINDWAEEEDLDKWHLP